MGFFDLFGGGLKTIGSVTSMAGLPMVGIPLTVAGSTVQGGARGGVRGALKGGGYRRHLGRGTQPRRPH
jgi:hypothetical protein